MVRKNILVCTFAALIILAVFSSACVSDATKTKQETQHTDQLVVGVSILPQKEFVQSIGGEHVTIMVLIPPGASPATYSPTTGQMVDIASADLYFKVGSSLPFEKTYLNTLITSNPEMAVINCSTGISITNNDPHIWNSPENAIIMCKNIATGLSEADPIHADDYQYNLEQYISQLNELDENLKIILNTTESAQPTEQIPFIVFHPAWGYFADRYNLLQVPVEVDGKEPSAKELAELINFARTENITTIFTDPQMSSDSANVIAQQIGGTIVYADPLAEDYYSNLMKMAETIRQVN